MKLLVVLFFTLIYSTGNDPVPQPKTYISGNGLPAVMAVLPEGDTLKVGTVRPTELLSDQATIKEETKKFQKSE